MTVFWIVAALLLAGALLLVLPSLWSPPRTADAVDAQLANLAVHRDQLREAQADIDTGLIGSDRAEQARREIERRVLEDTRGTGAAAHDRTPARRTALALVLLIPLASVLTYLQLGRPDATAPQLAAASAATGTAGAGRHSTTPEQIQQMVAALAERLKAQPGDAEGWLMLGRSYTALGRYRDAATAMRKAVDLLPPDAGLLADLADVTGMAQGKRLAGEPARLVQAALDLDPRHVKALALAGSVAFEAKDYANARAHWQRLLAVLPPESPLHRSVSGSILEATQLEAGAGAAPNGTLAAAPRAAASAAANDGTRAAGAAALRGEVVLSPELAARVGPADTLFVFARAVDGPRLPLAIQRLDAAGATRFAFTLDDSSAMSPQFKLSGAQRVVVGARISRSGDATPRSGDLVGQSEPLVPGTSGVRVVIDKVQP